VRQFLRDPAAVLERVREQMGSGGASAELEERLADLSKRLAGKHKERDRWLHLYAQSGAVGPEALVELRGRNIQNAVHLERAGVLDQDLGGAEFGAYPLESYGDRVRVCGVGGDRERRTAVALYVPPYLREAFFLARHHRDREAFAAETAGDCGP
jgi:hypothetical protein